MGVEIQRSAPPTAFSELSQQQQKAHRARIGVRAEAILGQFWRDDDTPDAIRAIEIEGWVDVLESCTNAEVRAAWTEYQRSGPRTRGGRLYKPDAGAIYRLVLRAKPAPPKAPPVEIASVAEPRVTPDRARAIMAEIYGFEADTPPSSVKKSDTSDA